MLFPCQCDLFPTYPFESLIQPCVFVMAYKLVFWRGIKVRVLYVRVPFPTPFFSYFHFDPWSHQVAHTNLEPSMQTRNPPASASTLVGLQSWPASLAQFFFQLLKSKTIIEPKVVPPGHHLYFNISIEFELVSFINSIFLS